MAKYVALLRGIGPGNPNMHSSKLRGVFESLGFSDVQSVISSGNVVFETSINDTGSLESLVEKALPEQLGFTSTTIIRSQEQIEHLLKLDPFEGLQHSTGSYLLVTFFKNPTQVQFELPYQPPDKTYKLIGSTDNALFTVTDNTQVKTTDLMTWFEKQFGKEISSRTWLTVQGINKKFSV